MAKKMKTRSNSKQSKISSSKVNKNHKIFDCNICFDKFTSAFALNRHINSVHLNKKIRCKYCGNKFSRINDHYKCCKKLIMKENNEFLSNLRIDNFGNIDYYKNSINNGKANSSYKGKIPIKLIGKKNCGKVDEYIYFKNRVIGKGAYSTVYYGFNFNSFYEIAVKEFSSLSNPIRVRNEIKVLKKLEGMPHFPSIFKYDKKSGKIIESLMGPTLKKLFSWCGYNFPEKTVANIGIEVLKRLKELHSKGIIHRDLKPENLCWGNFSSNENSDKMSIILIDYGLSDFYLDKNGKHIDFKTNVKYVGTLEYSSINSIGFNQQSRKDDLESLMYILILFLKGDLFWSKNGNIIKGNEFEYYKSIKELNTIDKLCKGLPREFSFIFESVQNLKFDSEPDYDIYVNILEKFIEKNIHKFEEEEFKFIWEKKLFELYNNTLKSHKYGMLTSAKNYLFPGFPISIYKYISSLKNDILFRFNIKSFIFK